MTHEGAQAKRKRDAPDSQTELSHDDHDDDVATAAAQLQQRGWFFFTPGAKSPQYLSSHVAISPIM